MWKDLINKIKEDKVSIIITSIISILITIVFGYYFMIMGQQKIDIRYTLFTVPIANTWNNDSLQYNDATINNMSLTIITITNKGNKALNGRTMLKKAPLTVRLDNGYKILDIYKQDRKTSTSLDYSLVADNNNITIPFEVLNPNDTLRFSIIHNGYSNDNFSITGNWENGNGLKNDTITIEEIEKRNIYFGITAFIILIVTLVTFIYISVKLNYETNFREIIFKFAKKYHELDSVIIEKFIETIKNLQRTNKCFN